MDEALRSRLEEIKKILNSFGWWVEKAGTTIHKSDIIMAVTMIERCGAEAEALLLQDEDGTRLYELIVVWIRKARHHLRIESLSDFHAVWDLVHINEPSLSTIIMKIDSFIYKKTGDIRTFFL